MAQDRKKNKSSVPSTKTEAGAEAPVKKKATGPFEFIRQVRAEVQKVTWTSLKETQVSTIMVLIMVFVLSIFFLFVDQAAQTIVQFILGFGNA